MHYLFAFSCFWMFISELESQIQSFFKAYHCVYFRWKAPNIMWPQSFRQIEAFVTKMMSRFIPAELFLSPSKSFFLLRLLHCWSQMMFNNNFICFAFVLDKMLFSVTPNAFWLRCQYLVKILNSRQEYRARYGGEMRCCKCASVLCSQQAG